MLNANDAGDALAPPFHMVLPVVRGGAAISTTASVLPSLPAKKDPAKTTNSRIALFLGTCCSPARAQIPGASAALTPPRSTRKRPPAGDAAPRQVASIRVSAHGVPHPLRFEGSARAALLEARAFFCARASGSGVLCARACPCVLHTGKHAVSLQPAPGPTRGLLSCDCALATRRRRGSAARVSGAGAAPADETPPRTHPRGALAGEMRARTDGGQGTSSHRCRGVCEACVSPWCGFTQNIAWSSPEHGRYAIELVSKPV